MGRAFDLAKAREAIRRTQRQMSIVQDRLKVNSTPISFAASHARHKLRDATTAVKRLKALIDASRGGRADRALASEIERAEEQLVQARTALSQAQPDL